MLALSMPFHSFMFICLSCRLNLSLFHYADMLTSNLIDAHTHTMVCEADALNFIAISARFAVVVFFRFNKKQQKVLWMVLCLVLHRWSEKIILNDRHSRHIDASVLSYWFFLFFRSIAFCRVSDLMINMWARLDSLNCCSMIWHTVPKCKIIAISILQKKNRQCWFSSNRKRNEIILLVGYKIAIFISVDLHRNNLFLI